MTLTKKCLFLSMQENLFIFSLLYVIFLVLWSKDVDNMMQLFEAFFNYFELQKFLKLFTFFQVHKSIEMTLQWQKTSLQDTGQHSS